MGTELTQKQEHYCQLAAFNSYADAYRIAYRPAPNARIHADIYELNKNPAIARRIEEIQREAAKPFNVTREWLIEWWKDRMLYDPAEITVWVHHCCRYCHGDNFGYQWREPEFMRAMVEAELTKSPLPDLAGGFGYDDRLAPHDECPHCNGRGQQRQNIADTTRLSPRARKAFDGIKETRQGIEIKMADRDVAARELAKLTGMDVAQVKVMFDDVPDDERIMQLRADPDAMMAAYKRLMG